MKNTEQIKMGGLYKEIEQLELEIVHLKKEVVRCNKVNTHQVFNDLIDIVIKNSCDNEVTITDVRLWAEIWREEMKQELNKI